MPSVERDVIESAMRDADLDEDKLYENYSGRFMYGHKCFGIVGGIEDYGKFLIQLTKVDYDLAWDLAQSVRTDDMGCESIFYFVGYQLADEDKEDEDCLMVVTYPGQDNE